MKALSNALTTLRSLLKRDRNPKKRRERFEVALRPTARDTEKPKRFLRPTKHGKKWLVWRQLNRTRRRKLLAMTWSRAVIAHVPSTFVALRAQAPQWPEKMTPEARAERMQRWARNKLKAQRKRRLVVDAPMPVADIAWRLDTVALDTKSPITRLRVKRTARLHGVSWKALRKAVRRGKGAAWAAMRREHEAA